MLAAALFLAAGIFFGRRFYPVIGLWPLCAVAIGAATALFAAKKLKLILMFPVLAVIGCLMVRGSITDDYGFLTETADSNSVIEISGVVEDVGLSSSGSYKAVIRVDEVLIEGRIHRARFNVQAYFDEGIRPEAGYRAQASGKLRSLRFQRNPGGYDEFTYLRSRKIQYAFHAESFTEEVQVFSISALLSRFSARCVNVLTRIMSEDASAVLSAMLLGDKSRLGDEIRETYQVAGVYHILAVSGLHVSIMALALTRLMKRLQVSPRLSGIICLTFLALYCVMTGASPSTVRAVIMSGIMVGGLMFHRGPDTLNSCACAAICLLIYEPLYLWDIGFQYSFSAVTGLAAGGPAVDRLFVWIGAKVLWIERLMSRSFIRANLPPTLAALIATLPVVVWHYHSISALAALANLIVIPTVALTVASGFAACLVGLFNTGLARMIGFVPKILAQFYAALCGWIEGISFSEVLTGKPNLPTIAAIGASLALIAWVMCWKDKDFKRRRGKRIIISCAAAVCVTVTVSAAIPKPLTVTLLDVGQGDCIVVSQGGKAFAIDGGGTDIDNLGKDTGYWTLLPYLASLGIERLDAAFVTHAHTDHAVGIIEAVSAGAVDRLILSASGAADEGIKNLLLEAAASADTEVAYITTGDRITFWDAVTIDCLYPSDYSVGEGNDASLALMARANSVSFMLAGDMEGHAEREVLAGYQHTLQADVLKLAHHGSRSSSSQGFLDAVLPEIALVSAGKNNMYGHPHPDVTGRLDAMSIPFYNTAELGAVMIIPNNGQYKIKYMAENADERTEQPIKIW
jgi:competence protein ComEC